MKVFDKVEGRRLLNELIHMLNEKNPVPSLTLMSVHGIPQALHPALDFNSKAEKTVEAGGDSTRVVEISFLEGQARSMDCLFFCPDRLRS